MKYTDLEKKIIEKGYQNFRKELREASKPMLNVLKKYGIQAEHELLKKITLSYPYFDRNDDDYAVNIPDDDNLKCLDKIILDNFMKEIEEIKSKVDNLDINN